MGAMSSLQSQSKTFGANAPINLWITSELVKRLDDAIPTAFAATDAVHSLATSTQTSGNATLTVTLRNGETFTTGSIAFDDSAATIEGLIDTAATAASVTGWTNGDISVSGGAVNVAPVVLTFDGASVTSIAHAVTTLADVDGAGGAWGAVTITTKGQTSRPALAVLKNYDIITGTPPLQDAVAATGVMAKGSGSNSIPTNIVKALMREASAEDDNQGTYFSLQATLMSGDRAPMRETSKTSDVLPS